MGFEVIRKLAAAIATRHEVKGSGIGGLECRLDCAATRKRNGSGRKSGPDIGVVRVVDLQVTSS